MPKTAESNEPRTIEFELQSPGDADGRATIRAYAVYYVCEEKGGTCQYRRQDIEIAVEILAGKTKPVGKLPVNVRKR